LDFDLCSRGVDFAKAIGRELDVRGAQVFFEVMKLGYIRNQHHPRLLCE
jgi:hypothetical protein